VLKTEVFKRCDVNFLKLWTTGIETILEGKIYNNHTIKLLCPWSLNDY
jgi:hypothetical protein